MTTECGRLNIRASAFENEVLIVEYDIQMRSLLSRILLGVERDPCHFFRMTDLTFRINSIYIQDRIVVARKKYIKISKATFVPSDPQGKEKYLSRYTAIPENKKTRSTK
jgi:hypothetical protein